MKSFREPEPFFVMLLAVIVLLIALREIYTPASSGAAIPPILKVGK